jgi:hypothetical protein
VPGGIFWGTELSQGQDGVRLGRHQNPCWLTQSQRMYPTWTWGTRQATYGGREAIKPEHQQTRRASNPREHSTRSAQGRGRPRGQMLEAAQVKVVTLTLVFRRQPGKQVRSQQSMSPFPGH